MCIHGFIDAGLGHSSYVIELVDGMAAMFDGGPGTWAAATGRPLEVDA